MTKIRVLFQTESHYLVNRKKIKDAIVKALDGKVKRNAEVSVSVIGDRRMRQLNREFRNIDKTTDVLSFPLNDSTHRPGSAFVDVPDDVLRLGDIVLSFPEAVKEARQQNKLVDDVMIFLTLHGLNHLLGIHHTE